MSQRTLLRADGSLETASADDLPAPLARFLEEGGGSLLLAPADDPFVLDGKLAGVSLIAIDFPHYKDGRGYTHARHLREQLGYRGELRAVGDVGVDHLYNMRRCGFDAFVLREGTDVERAKKALSQYTVAYQPTSWGPR